MDEAPPPSNSSHNTGSAHHTSNTPLSSIQIYKPLSLSFGRFGNQSTVYFNPLNPITRYHAKNNMSVGLACLVDDPKTEWVQESVSGYLKYAKEAAPNEQPTKIIQELGTITQWLGKYSKENQCYEEYCDTKNNEIEMLRCMRAAYARARNEQVKSSHYVCYNKIIIGSDAGKLSYTIPVAGRFQNKKISDEAFNTELDDLSPKYSTYFDKFDEKTDNENKSLLSINKWVWNLLNSKDYDLSPNVTKCRILSILDHLRYFFSQQDESGAKKILTAIQSYDYGCSDSAIVGLDKIEMIIAVHLAPNDPLALIDLGILLLKRHLVSKYSVIAASKAEKQEDRERKHEAIEYELRNLLQGNQTLKLNYPGADMRHSSWGINSLFRLQLYILQSITPEAILDYLASWEPWQHYLKIETIDTEKIEETLTSEGISMNSDDWTVRYNDLFEKAKREQVKSIKEKTEPLLEKYGYLVKDPLYPIPEVLEQVTDESWKEWVCKKTTVFG